MNVEFTKMQGAGNDFVVIDSMHEPFSLSVPELQFLADRHFGVGADQILVVEKDKTGDADFKYRIFNQDGGEVQQCGNGARCFARFVFDRGLTQKKKIRVRTVKGVIEPEIIDDKNVSVMMGIPSFKPEDLPFLPGALPERTVNGIRQWGVEFEGKTYWFVISSMGNPHATFTVDDVSSAPVHTLGAFVEKHPAFPERVNVGFLEVCSPSEGRVRVWERGAAETLACGTGNCAAAAAGINLGLLSDAPLLHTRGGDLEIRWKGPGTEMFLIGPAVTIFESSVEITPDKIRDMQAGKPSL